MIKRAISRLSHGLPVLQLLAIAQIALLAGSHLALLDAPERRRLAVLLRRGRGRPSRLGQQDADELRALIAKLQPRLLFGSAVKRLSPVPVPKRVLYGRRGNPARSASA